MNIYLSEKEKDNKTDQEANKVDITKSLFIFDFTHIFFLQVFSLPYKLIHQFVYK